MFSVRCFHCTYHHGLRVRCAEGATPVVAEPRRSVSPPPSTIDPPICMCMCVCAVRVVPLIYFYRRFACVVTSNGSRCGGAADILFVTTAAGASAAPPACGSFAIDFSPSVTAAWSLPPSPALTFCMSLVSVSPCACCVGGNCVCVDLLRLLCRRWCVLLVAGLCCRLSFPCLVCLLRVSSVSHAVSAAAAARCQ